MSFFSWGRKKPDPVSRGTDTHLRRKEKEISAIKEEAQEKLSQIAKDMRNKTVTDKKFYDKTIQEIHAVADKIALAADRVGGQN